ncbi:MAG: 2-amino-4-hydroxy-6-hydroxymethyldihydropteridine diphosphokinase [Gammaproteobacteria bacterium]|nr:2-amino-4-hydroxy-6-hydroxymethyldihydropteridine diphosphokinase [Chromatiales bacterium]MCP4925271.1 2-amino-4-hydroxy-6-hydroxymethyldihydropteridine diphosphokinase [Gammaproteobacteria bacterium]
MVDVYVSAGSNIDPEHHLRAACHRLADRFGSLSLSSVYRTKAVGFAGDDFLNLVLSFSTDVGAYAVKEYLDLIEADAGREPSAQSLQPRTLDLDLLLYGDVVLEEPTVQVPRTDILRYAFVLAPFAELVPDLRHPVDGRTMHELWAAFAGGEQGIRRLAKPLL